MRRDGGTTEGPLPRCVSVRFPARFLALAAGIYAVGSFVEPLRAAATRLAMLGVPAASSAFGVTAETSADGVASFADGQFAYLVTFECASVSAIVLLVSAILTYPSTERYPITFGQRFWASVAAVVGLTLLNYVRLGALAWIGVNAPDQFEAAHVYWFQGFTFLAVGLGWLAWIRLVARRDPLARSADGPALELRRFGTRFAAVFIPFTAAGLLLGLDRMYAQAIGLLSILVTPFVWGADLARPDVSATQVAYFFAAFVALLALMLATPRTSRAESLRGFVFAAPLLALGQVTALVAQIGAGAGPNGLPGWGMVEGLLVLPMAMAIGPLPLAIWFAWVERYLRSRRDRRGAGCSAPLDTEVAEASTNRRTLPRSHLRA